MVIEVVRFNKLENIFYKLLNMITKKLVKDIITFHNEFVGLPGVITKCCVYNTKTIYAVVGIELHYFTDDINSLKDKLIINISKCIYNYDDFNNYKNEVTKEFTDIEYAYDDKFYKNKE